MYPVYRRFHAIISIRTVMSQLIPSFRQDFRYSLRQLFTNPGFALTAILSLALGIGATVSVFSVIYGVLLHPFPYANIDRLANLSIRDAQETSLTPGSQRHSCVHCGRRGLSRASLHGTHRT